jgi:hypothetical protein
MDTRMQRIKSVNEFRKFMHDFYWRQTAGWVKDAPSMVEGESASDPGNDLEATQVAAWLWRAMMTKSFVRTRFVKSER